jgi:hypothetical protein
MATVRLQPLALIDKCIGEKIWVIMKVGSVQKAVCRRAVVCFFTASVRSNV